MADEWTAYERLRHAVLTEVPSLMGDGSWCLAEAGRVMKDAPDHVRQLDFIQKQLERLMYLGLLRYERGVYIPVKPVQRPVL